MEQQKEARAIKSNLKAVQQETDEREKAMGTNFVTVGTPRPWDRGQTFVPRPPLHPPTAEDRASGNRRQQTDQ